MSLLLPAAAVGAAYYLLREREGEQAVSAARRQTGGGSNGRAVNAEPSADVLNVIVSGARAFSVAPAFALADAACESRFNPRAELNTLGRTDLRAGTQPERSLGLFQVNVNPNKPTGRQRIAVMAQQGKAPEALFEPAYCTGFWLAYVVLPTMAIVDRTIQDRSSEDYWVACRVKMYALTLSLTGARAQEIRGLFLPVLRKWTERYPL